jgi:hypothetical protein
MGSRAAAIGLGLLSLALLVQSIYLAESKLSLLTASALTLLCYLGSKGRPDVLLFLLVGLGPLINFPGFTPAPYMYNVEAALLCYFAVWFVASQRRVTLDGVLVTLYALFFLTLVPGTVAQWIAGDMAWQLRLLRGFFLGLCLVVFFNSTRQALARNVPLLLRSMLVAGFCVVIWGLLELLLADAGRLQFRHEPRSLFSGSASLAIYLLIVIPVAIAYRVTPGTRGGRVLATIVVVGGFLLLLATRSRIALIALLLSGGLYLIFSLVTIRGARTRLAAGVLGFVLAALAGLSMVVYKTLETSALQVGDIPHLLGDLARLADTLLRSRLAAWSHGMEQIISAPLVGNGAMVNVYNVYLQVAGAFGLPALIAFGLLLGYCLWPGRKRDGASGTGQSAGDGLLWSMVALLWVGLAESTLGNQLAYLVWTVFLLVGLRHHLGPASGPQAGRNVKREPSIEAATIPVGRRVPDWDIRD